MNLTLRIFIPGNGRIKIEIFLLKIEKIPTFGEYPPYVGFADVRGLRLLMLNPHFS
jgi:hypothetical protein